MNNDSGNFCALNEKKEFHLVLINSVLTVLKIQAVSKYIRLPSMKVEVVGKETSCTLGEATATGGWLILIAVRKIGLKKIVRTWAKIIW